MAVGIGLYLGLTAFSLPRQSATFDEGAHLPAGYAALALGDYRMNPEHPPLLKLWAAAPLLALQPRLDTADESWQRGRQWRFGHRFLYDWNDADRLLFWGRWPIVALACALIAAVFFWARRQGGGEGGAPALAALFLAALSPDLLAHGQLVTTDVGFTLFFFLTVAGFAGLVERITWARVLGTGLALGAAAASKFSVVILPPLLLLLLAVAVVRSARPDRLRRAAALAGCLLAAGALAWLTVWAAYRFRFTISPDPAASALLDWGQVTPPPGLLRTAAGWMREHRVLPEGYLFGFLQVFRLSEARPAFLAGQVSSQGWWYYFPATFALKTPLALLALLGLSFAARSRVRGFLAYALWLPVAVYWLITLTRHLNIGHRHLLPIYPFLFLLAGRAVLLARGRLRIGIAILGLWYASAALRVAPHYLASFNELAGGPSHGYRWLVDSNLDWGQDLRNLKHFLDRERIERVKLSYFGTADPAYYGIPGELLPGHILPAPARVTRQIAPGDVLAVSATNLQGIYLEDPRDLALMALLRTRRPFAEVGYSLLLYRADFSWPPPAP